MEYRSISQVIVSSALLILSSIALASNSGVTYQGRILKPDGSPLAGANTQFKLQIRTPDSSSCLMYEEVQSLDLRNTNGAFSLTINDGTGSRTDTTGFGLDRVFANRGSFTFNPATCSSGSTYTPNENDGRDLVVLFKDETMVGWEPIPSQKINFVPFTFESKQVGGFTSDSLLRVVNGSGDPLTGVAPLSNAQYTALLALANGSSTTYTKTGELNGVTLPTMNSGEALGWNGTAWVSTPAGVPAANSVTTTMLQSGAVTSAKLDPAISISTSGTVASAITTTRDFKIYAASPSTFYVGMLAPALSASYTLTWPMNVGTNGQVLTSNGAGTLTWTTPSSAGITALTGDVTATGPGSAAATVASVGGSTAALVHSAELAANGAVSTNTPSTIVKRDGSGGFAAGAVNAGSVVYRDGSSNTVTIQAPSSVTSSYVLKWPAATGSASQVLGTDGAGNLTWTSPLSSSSAFVQGGNTFGANADLGTNDAFDLNLRTAGTSRLTVTSAGSVGIGTTSPQGALDVSATRTTPAGNWYAGYGGISFSPTANQTSGRTAGFYGVTSVPATSTFNIYDMQGVRAYSENLGSGNTNSHSGFANRSINSSTGTTTIFAGELLQVEQNAGNVTSLHGLNAKITTTGGNVTDEYGLRTNSTISGGSVTNRYGLHLIATGTATNDYGVYQATATQKNFFAGNVGIGTTAPVTQVQVTGSLTLGDGGETCGSTYYGAIRYFASGVQFCGPGGWTTLGSGTGSGTVTSVTSANADIAVATTTTTPVLTLNSGTGANQIVKLTAAAKYPAVDGSLITNIDASNISAGTLPVSRGGTGATTLGTYSVVASNAAGNASAVPGSLSGSVLQHSVTGPAWSSMSLPTSTTANQLLYSSATNVVSGLSTANNSILVTNASGVPSFAATLPTGVQSNITQTGTITSGVWNGTAIGTAYGGTGLTGYTTGDLIYASSASALAKLPAATSGYVLTSNGAGTAPSWQAAPTGSQWTTQAPGINYTGGSVGIGTTSPSSMLHVTGDVRTDLGFVMSGAGTVRKYATNDMAVRLLANGNFYVNDISDVPKFAVTQAGNVGIGTTSPGYPLDVSGGTGARIMTSTQFQGLTVTNGTNVIAKLYGNTAANDAGQLQLSNAGTANVQIAANNVSWFNGGSVGIGTTSPTSPLTVVKSGSGYPLTIAANSGAGPGNYVNLAINNTTAGAYKGAIEFQNNGSGKYSLGVDYLGAGTQNFSLYDNVAGAMRFWVGPTGLVGIGTTSPNGNLDVKGSVVMSGSTSGYNGFKAAAAAGSTIWTLPVNDGTNGQVLSTNGSGTLAWSSPGAGTVTSVTSANTDIGVATTTTTPVLTLNSGTGANQIVKLTAASKYPAVDGSLITNLDATNISAGTLPVSRGGTGATTLGTYSVLASNAAGNTTAVPGSLSGSVLQYSVTGPTWSSMSLPTSTTANQILYSSANNVVGAITTASNGMLATNASGVPAIVSTIPTALQSSITTVGTVTSGTWNGTAIGAAYGGTGQTSFTTGDLLYASSSSALSRLPAATSGYVLTSNGAGTAPSWQASSGSSQWTTQAPGINYTGGSVGIGTTSPIRSLHVEGTTYIGQGNGSASDPRLEVRANPWSGTGDFTSQYLYTVMNGTTANTGTIKGFHSNVLATRSGGVNTVNGIVSQVDAGGGIGAATNITSLVASVGTSSSNATTTLRGASLTTLNNGSGTVTDGVGLYTTVTNSGSGSITNGYGVYVDSVAGTNAYGFYQNSASNKNYFAGNVGIGTTSPSKKLSVQTTGGSGWNSSQMSLGEAGGTPWDIWAGSGLRIGMNGVDFLALNGAGFALGLNGMNVPSFAGNANGIYSSQTLYANANGDKLTGLWIDPYWNDQSYSGVAHNGLIVTRGNVGIGTTSPSTTLHVAGDLTVTTMAANAAGDRPVFVDSNGKFKKGYSNSSTFVDVSGAIGQVISGYFPTVIMSTVASDVSGLYNTSTGIYTVPVSGLYQISGSFRVVDGSPAGQSFGVGVHTSNGDGPWFFWHAVQATTDSGQRRTTYPYLRLARFNAGDQLRMFSYSDGGITVSLAGMQILRIGE